VEYSCFNGEGFLRFDFIQYGRHAFSYVLVQVTVNVPLIRLKLLRAINGNPDSYLYSCLCERSLTRSGPLSSLFFTGKLQGAAEKSGPLNFFAVFSATIWNFDMKFYSFI